MTAQSARLPATNPEERVLPFNIDVEQALIGAVMLNNDVFMRVSNIVQVEHFHEEMHQAIWSTIAALITKGQVANPILLKTYLGNPELAPGKTLIAYLSGLVTGSTGYANAESYARTIRDLYLRRQFVTLSERLASIAYEAPVDATAETIFADVERDLEALRPAVQKDDDGWMDFGRVESDDVYDAYQRGAGVVGLSTGFQRLDDVLGGLQNSDLIILAGRPAMGKTALATNIGVSVARHVRARRAAGENLGPVGIFSLEMSRKQLKTRIVADMANVSARKLRQGDGTSEEMTAFNDADRDLADLPLTIDHTGALPIASIKMRARALKKRRGLSLLIVDYLQLITGSEKRGRDHNRTQEVTEITTGLKALAKELDVPIIALSQLSRKVEERDDKRPMLADLRESGSIEQDADSVIFVYREEYYLRKNKPRDEGEALGNWYAKMKRWENVAEAIVAKNRHGPEESVELGFEGEFTRFSNEPPWRPADPEEARSKKVKLTAHAEELRTILRELSNVVASRPTIEDLVKKNGLPPNAMLVPREDVRREFFARVVPDLPDAEQRRKLQAAADNLRNNKLTEAFNDASGKSVVYLVELVTE